MKSGASSRQSDFLHIHSLTFLFIAAVDWLAFRFFFTIYIMETHQAEGKTSELSHKDLQFCMPPL